MKSLSRYDRHADLDRPASIAFAFDAQMNAEIDKLIFFVQTSGVRSIRNRKENSQQRVRSILRDKLAKADDRVKTPDELRMAVSARHVCR